MGDVGGNTLGFYGGVFAPDGATILGHGYQGAFHVWHHNVSCGNITQGAMSNHSVTVTE